MPEVQVVELFGASFEISGDISPFAMLEFAEAASSGEVSESMEGLGSLLRFVKECIAEKDRSRFLASARKNRANGEDLTKVIEKVFSVETKRPTERPSDSSDGPRSIGPSSPSNADAKDSSRFTGRPDLRLALARTA